MCCCRHRRRHHRHHCHSRRRHRHCCCRHRCHRRHRCCRHIVIIVIIVIVVIVTVVVVVIIVVIVVIILDIIVIVVILLIYVEQARHDEESRVTDQSHSLADDIRLIEEQGIYHLLCSIHLSGGGNSDSSSTATAGQLDAAVARGVMLLGCSALEHQAPVDNRNYMTFYALERLLLRIIEQDLSHVMPSSATLDDQF